MTVSPDVRGALLALLAMGIFATHDVIIKTLGATYPSLQILFFASLMSFPLVSVVLMRDRTHGTLRPNRPGWVALRSVCGVLAGIGGFYAFSTLPLAQVYAILFSSPLIVTVLSIPILGEKVGSHRWVAVILGLVGVLIVLRPGGQGLALGHAAALISAIGSATAAVIVRKLGRTERPMVLILWPMLGNFVVSGASLGWDYRPMELPDLAMTGVIAVFGLTAAFLVIQAYRTAEAAIVAPMQYSQILWATAYGWFLFGEHVDAPTLTGAGIIIASGIYILWREGRGGNSVNRPVLASRIGADANITPKSTVLQRLWAPRR